MLRLTWISALGLCAGAGLFAQGVPAVVPDTVSAMKLQAEAGNMNVRFMSAEFGFGGKTVKGMPYSAQAVTETTQTLADGNHIVHKSTALLARDGEGRTRREQTLDKVGQWSTGDQPPAMIFINDPVGQANYVLEPNTKTARKMPFLGEPGSEHSLFEEKNLAEAKMKMDARKAQAAGDTHLVTGGSFVTAGGPVGGVVVATGGGEMVHTMNLDAGEMVTDSLGSKTFDGVVAEGKRFTRTVPAGKMGNERPLVYVNETWYSAELGMMVMSKHSDPQMGETTYTLTNIQRAEPDPTLFTVPAEYSVKEGGKEFFFDKRVK